MITRKKIICYICALCCATALPVFCIAQKGISNDSSYYAVYPDALTARFYFSKKYAPFTFPSIVDERSLKYMPNTQLTMGVGATYHNFSLNLAYGFGFLNNNENKGKTKGIDLQLHLYPGKWAIDALGIFHKGSYIDNFDGSTYTAEGVYSRPDVHINYIGGAAYRVPNGERFSYRAAMIQNEWQKKSAGSLLYGGMAGYGSIKGDSSLVPVELKADFAQSGVTGIHYWNAAAGLGYAYTLVVAEHLFVTGSLTGNAGIYITSEETPGGTDTKVTAGPSIVYKAAAGYNSSTWNISANWAGNAMLFKGSSSSESYFSPTGNFRLILAKKIPLKK